MLISEREEELRKQVAGVLIRDEVRRERARREKEGVDCVLVVFDVLWRKE
jgi:hypothetical protein